MEFRISLVENVPLTAVNDLNTVLLEFLEMIGYLPKGYTPRNAAISPRESIPFRLFRDAFLLRSDRAWTVDELAAMLDTSRPTIYRHLKKLRSMRLLEETRVTFADETGSVTRKAYRLRRGDLLQAWMSVEENINNALRNYRATVEHIHALSSRQGKVVR